MGRELEYKFAARPEQLQQIARCYPGLRQIKMRTVYFDTVDGSLSKAHCTLRLRQENDVSVCTLKTPLPDGSRAEWECLAPSIEEGLAQMPQALLAGPVVPVCGAQFTRLALTLALPEATVELALDSGALSGGGREIPLCEVEVEHKSGSEAAAKAFALALAARFGLTEEKNSKFARAIALAKGASHG